MTKQVLSIEQMLHLQQLGIDTSNASASWYRAEPFEDFQLMPFRYPKEELVWSEESIPAFTLQDILDILPVTIRYERNTYELRLKRMHFKREMYEKTMWAVLYENVEDIEHLIMYSEPDLLDAAYNFLLHCIKEGFINTRKEERP